MQNSWNRTALKLSEITGKKLQRFRDLTYLRHFSYVCEVLNRFKRGFDAVHFFNCYFSIAAYFNDSKDHHGFSRELIPSSLCVIGYELRSANASSWLWLMQKSILYFFLRIEVMAIPHSIRMRVRIFYTNALFFCISNFCVFVPE